LDQAKSNYAAENAIIKERGPMWDHLGIFCHLHILFGCMTKVFVEVDKHISGMVHIALSLR
jgi:hypothetical protein